MYLHNNQLSGIIPGELVKNNLNLQSLKLNKNKIVVLADNMKVITNKEFKKIIQLPEDGENDYLEILKTDDQNVWFFYQNLIVNYNFKRNKVIKTYDVTKWNAHQVKIDKNDLWLISKNDGQLYHIKLELSKKELDEKIVRLKKEKEQGYIKPDKARIEVQKALEEKLNKN